MSSPKIIHAKINGISVEVPEGTNILEAARQAKINIPTLCKHPDLVSTAACGLCIVRIKGNPKLLRACTTPLAEGMEITTHDPELTEIRRTVLELILSNHPNECQTCLRNTNCELQKLAADFGLNSEPLPRTLSEYPKDVSNGSITIDFAKCIKCGRCVNVCQNSQNVWALSFVGRGFGIRMAPSGDIVLNESPCVKCGQCAAHCPTGAIVENDDTKQVWDALQNQDNYCTVQIAPAVRVSIGESFGLPPGTNLTKKLYTALRRLGFKAVFDTNFSADLTIMEESAEFVHRFKTNTKLPLITSCCPAWTDFMEKFHGDFIENFSTAKSPQQMLGAMAKTYYAQKMGINPGKIVQVSIMPCTAKKYELERTNDMRASGHNDVDIVITTREFARMLKQAGIDFTQLEDSEADSILGQYSGGGTLFGATGGVMEAAIRTAYFNLTGANLPKEAIEIQAVRGIKGVKEGTIDVQGTPVKVAVAHGLANVEYLLSKVREARVKGLPSPYHFIEVMACPGGCIGGGGQPYGITDAIRLKRMQGLYQDDRDCAARCSHDNPEIKHIYKDFLAHPLSEKSHKLLHTKYVPRPMYQK